jgi:hypothetical protein
MIWSAPERFWGLACCSPRLSLGFCAFATEADGKWESPANSIVLIVYPSDLSDFPSQSDKNVSRETFWFD